MTCIRDTECIQKKIWLLQTGLPSHVTSVPLHSLIPGVADSRSWQVLETSPLATPNPGSQPYVAVVLNCVEALAELSVNVMNPLVGDCSIGQLSPVVNGKQLKNFAIYTCAHVEKSLCL